MDSLQLGKLLSTRRKDLSLTQSELALSIGVNRRVIGELERGKPTVQLQVMLKAAQALGLDIDLKARL